MFNLSWLKYLQAVKLKTQTTIYQLFKYHKFRSLYSRAYNLSLLTQKQSVHFGLTVIYPSRYSLLTPNSSLQTDANIAPEPYCLW